MKLFVEIDGWLALLILVAYAMAGRARISS